jgi:EmrB/QacA subfamily drug resistance transporter
MSRHVLVAIIVGFAFFMQNLDSTVVTTALPQMARSFHVSPVDLSLAITTYVVSIAVFTPISGWFADRFGASAVFQASILLFSLASLGCAMSESVPILLLARIVQGVGTAMTIPVGRLVLLRSVPKADWVRVLTYIQVSAQFGLMIGPLVGGFIATYSSWRWIFLINIPVGLLGVILARLYIENHKDAERTPLDWLGFLLTGAAFAFIMYTVEALGNGSIGGAVAFLCLLAGLGFGAASVWHALRHPHPLLNLRLLRIPSFRTNLTGGSLYRISFGAMPFLLPLLFQVVFGMTALSSGLLTFPTAAGAVAVQFLAAYIFRRSGFRNFLIWNGILCALIIFGCALLTPGTSAYVIVGLLIGWGFFQSLQFNALNTLAFCDLDAQTMSIGSSMAQLVQQFTSGMGVAVAAFILQMSLNWRASDHLATSDFRIAFVLDGILCLSSLPFYFRLAGNAGAEVSGHRPEPTFEA